MNLFQPYTVLLMTHTTDPTALIGLINMLLVAAQSKLQY